MRADYYRDYYRLERENWWFLARKKILQDQVRVLYPDKQPLRILNVGAALGASTIMLQEFGEVTSLEYDKSCCDFVKAEFGLDFINGSITELPFADKSFDLVCAFDVVEHVEEDVLAVSELYRVCTPGGHIFTTVPAFRFLWSEHDEINQHVRRYTLKNFSSLFSGLSGKVAFSSYFNSWLFPPIALVRSVTTLVKKPRPAATAESDFGKVSNGLVSKILYRIFRSETILLKRKIRLPAGVSIMVIFKKK